MEWFKINFEAVAVSLNTIEIIIKKRKSLKSFVHNREEE